MNIPAFLTGLGIRQKLAVMLVVPLVGLLYFATSGVVERLGTLHQAGDLQDNAALAVKVSGLVHELQRERGTTVLFLGSKGKDFGKDLSDQRTLTDQKLKELRQYLQTFDANRFGKPYANRLDKAVGGLGLLSAKRSSVDSLQADPPVVVKYYSGTIAKLLEVVGAISTVSNDAELSRLGSGYVSLLSLKERAGQERAALAKAFKKGGFEKQEDFVKFSGLVAAQETYEGVFRSFATPAQVKKYISTVSGPDVNGAKKLEELALTNDPAKMKGVDPKKWFELQTAKINLLKEVEDSLSGDLVSTAAQIKSDARSQLVVYALIALFGLVIALGLAGFIGLRIVRGVKQMLTAADGISEGDLDQDVAVTSRDELGALAQSFQRMIDYLKEMAAHAERMAGNDLTVDVRPRSERDVLSNAFARMAENLRTTIGEVSRAAANVSSSSQQMAMTSEEAGRAAGEIASAVGEVAQGAERQVRMVESARQTTAETAEAATQARSLAEDGVHAAKEASEAMHSVRNSTKDVTEAIRSLGSKSEQIGGIVETITGIAGQTNLLALNAAIEAARAGEQGRGFAVVAEEVRKLAEESQTAAATISSLIEEIQAETTKVVQVVEEGAKHTDDSAAVVERTREAFLKIGESVSDMAGRIEQVASATLEVAAVAEQSSASSEEVSASTEETSASTQEIAATAQQLANTAEELERLVGLFKLAA
jgi:methyl-accepting chemotaxis protein